MFHPSQSSVLLLFPLTSLMISQEERKPILYMLHLIICWRRENSRNVQGIQVRVLLMLMRCLLQSNSNYPPGDVKRLGSSTISIIAWEYEKPMKFKFSQSGDDQQYMCLHVLKMASLDAKVALNNCNCFHYLVQWNGTRLTWALSYPDHCLFLIYKRKKEANGKQNRSAMTKICPRTDRSDTSS